MSWLPAPVDYPAIGNPILLNPSFGLFANTLNAGTRSLVNTYVMVSGAPTRFTLRSTLQVSGGRFDPPAGGSVHMTFTAQLTAGGGLCNLGWTNGLVGDGTFGGTCTTAADLDLLPGVPYPISFDMRASASIRTGGTSGGDFVIDPNVGISSLSLTDERGNELDLGSILAPVEGLRFTPNGIVSTDVPEPGTLISSLVGIGLALVARRKQSSLVKG